MDHEIQAGVEGREDKSRMLLLSYFSHVRLCVTP